LEKALVRLVEPGSEQHTRPVYLYRHFDAGGVLLYAGISLNHLHRLAEHRATSPWFDQITNVELECFPSWAHAKAAEDKVIIEEKPLYNIAGSANPPFSRSAKRDEVLDRIDQQTSSGRQIASVYRERATKHMAVGERELIREYAEVIVLLECLRREWFDFKIPTAGLLKSIPDIKAFLKKRGF
jgi:hypothetical protein